MLGAKCCGNIQCCHGIVCHEPMGQLRKLLSNGSGKFRKRKSIPGTKKFIGMNILETITQYKMQELPVLKKQVAITALKDSALFERNCISLSKRLKQPNATGIIAEFKRKSPSKGIINATAKVEDVTAAYTNAGASGLSVLTDRHFFGGCSEDLLKARMQPNAILRKDFIVDAYQLTESKSMGADVILLIAACLSPMQVNDYAAEAKELGRLCCRSKRVGHGSFAGNAR